MYVRPDFFLVLPTGEIWALMTWIARNGYNGKAILAAYGQWSVFDHNGDNQLVVLGTRYEIWWPWYGQFGVGWLQPLQPWLGAGTLVAPVLVSQDRDLCHVQLHPTWLEPTSECSWPVVSYLYSGYLPVGLYLCRGSLLLVDPLSFPLMPQWLGTQQKRTRVPLSLNDQSRFLIWQIKGFSVSSPPIACKQDIWVRVDYHIVMDWAYVLVIVQTQTAKCKLYLLSYHEAFRPARMFFVKTLLWIISHHKLLAITINVLHLNQYQHRC